MGTMGASKLIAGITKRSGAKCGTGVGVLVGGTCVGTRVAVGLRGRTVGGTGVAEAVRVGEATGRVIAGRGVTVTAIEFKFV